jgi:hypothetical protein
METQGPDVTVIPPTLDNHSHFKVMQWPARTHFGCTHTDCMRRRRERNVPCAACGARIRDGQEYRPTSHVAGEVVSQIHRACERRRFDR